MEFAEHGEGDESGFVDPVGLIGYGVLSMTSVIVSAASVVASLIIALFAK